MMQNHESLKRSIGSAEDLGSVVRTMKTMAAVSIRQYETATESLKEYSRTIETGLRMLLRKTDDDSPHLNSSGGRTGAIIFGSDQGMCGQFNEQIAQFAMDYLKQEQTESDPHTPVICIGNRVADKFLDQPGGVAETMLLPGSADGITALVQDLLPTIDGWRADHQITRILVFHNRRLSASSWRPYAMQLLPLRVDRLAAVSPQESEQFPGRSLPLWTMDTSVLFSRLVKQFLFVSLFRACAESLAGENASRIAAMQAAEKNINERLHALRAEYSQQRQTTITEELLDVVTGYEALMNE